MVLNGKGDDFKINPETQKRIKSAAEKYRYRPNLIAKNLSQGKSMILGLIVPNIADTYYSNIADAIESYAISKGYKVLLGNTKEDPQKEKELLLTFEAQQVDGIMIASTQHNLEDIERMLKQGMPIVLFDRHYPNAELPHVVVDNYQGIKLLLEHLQKQGRKKIGYVGVDLDLTAIYERKRGYKENLKTQQQEYLKNVDYANAGRECMQAVEELIRQGVDALVFETHYLALHGIRRINDLNLHYPKDLSIASYGDHEVFTIFKPYITAIDQPTQKIASNAFEVLMQMLEPENTSAYQYKIIAPELYVRDS